MSWPEKVAVLGAGVMGVQIAALLVAAGRRVLVLDLADPSDQTAVARAGIRRGLKWHPPAFYTPEMADQIELGSLDDLSSLSDVDWVIEAIVEDPSAKKDLLARVESEVGGHAVISSNTSGLSIADLLEGRTEDFGRRFLGVHFFNPPRHMRLVEVIPAPHMDRDILRQVTQFLQNELGKGVVVARDTPNFIANRLGVFAIMSMLHLMDRETLSVPEVDAISGHLMARPKSATLRLCDLIGLDTLSRVAQTAYRGLVDDPWREVFSLPPSIEHMLKAGLLGAKAGGGFYRKTEDGILTLNMETLQYEKTSVPELDELGQIKGKPSACVRALWEAKNTWGVLGRAHLREVLLYSAWHAEQLADETAEIDRAMRWGFNWDLGPFELGDLLSWEQVIEDVHTVPQAIVEVLAGEGKTFYAPGGNMPGEAGGNPAPIINRKEAVFENDEAFICPLPRGAAALVFCGKINTLGLGVIEAVRWVMDSADLKGLILCGQPPHFSAGANLQYIRGLDQAALARFLYDFQQAIESLRRASFPVVAAVRGLCLGGGCEFAFAADRRVVAVEARLGLVEAGVGLLPSGGGIAHMARTKRGSNLVAAHRAISTGLMCGNAFEAQKVGFLQADDLILFDEENLLPKAVETLNYLMESWQIRPADLPIQPVGYEIGSAMDQWVDEQVDGGRFTAHDAVVARALTGVLCGRFSGEHTGHSDEVLALERTAFMTLYNARETQQRIDYMLKTGKRLKN